MNKELQFLIYNTPQEDIKVNVAMRDETIWLTQRAMADLSGVQIPAINKHLKNIFEESELNKETTISKMEIVQIEHYPGYLSKKPSIFQKIAEFVEEFKGIGGQYRDDEISRGTLIFRQTARFRISQAGRFRNILCGNCL